MLDTKPAVPYEYFYALAQHRVRHTWMARASSHEGESSVYVISRVCVFTCVHSAPIAQCKGIILNRTSHMHNKLYMASHFCLRQNSLRTPFTGMSPGECENLISCRRPPPPLPPKATSRPLDVRLHRFFRGGKRGQHGGPILLQRRTTITTTNASAVGMQHKIKGTSGRSGYVLKKYQ